MHYAMVALDHVDAYGLNPSERVATAILPANVFHAWS
jgi:hypothetical protein